MTTRERLQTSLGIDQAPTAEIVRIIQQEDRTIAGAVEAVAPRIALAIDAVADRMEHGGRLVYVGAGTSGRIAMLDAVELPPTYGIDPDLVQVIMAGGREAFFRAIEGAEDDESAAVREIESRVRAEDVVVGIAASGTTPFTVMAVRRANLQGSLTVGITSNPESPLAQECDIAIAPATGPEVILGSTRMKSGTAQKMVLNTLSTGVMIRLGKVYSNLMVEMPATNEKLRRRALRMVELGAEVDAGTAADALARSEGRVKEAIVIARKKVSLEEARRLLEAYRGRLREVLQE